MTIMRFRYASEEDRLPALAEHYRDKETDIIIAEEDGEILGATVYSENENFGVLEHVEVYSDNRGKGVGSQLVEKAFEQSNKENLYSQATAMSGKIQKMLQNRGFEVSGMRAGNQVSEPQPHASGGFNLNLWKLDDEKVQAYIPEEVQGFADSSLKNQREVEYVEPKAEHQTGSFDIVRSVLSGESWGGGKRTNRLDIEIGDGTTLETNIAEAIKGVDSDDYWAKTVSIDTNQPIAYSIARTLHDEGFQPIDFSPVADGQELTMLDLDAEAGMYGVTDETLELIDSTGLDYTVEGHDDQTTRITFQP